VSGESIKTASARVDLSSEKLAASKQVSRSGNDTTVAPAVRPFFSVCTPTYNRAHTLHRVFESLCAQTFRDFEWLVVDDGSTDDTSELIGEWKKFARFPIRYFRQPNSGRHIADNLAMREARGEILAGVDSDDALVPNALERIWHLWHEIPGAERSDFLGIVGHCCDQKGKLIGQMFPASPFDTNYREFVFTHRRFGGQKWDVCRSDISRQYPTPAIDGTNYVPEAVTGLQAARMYKIRCVNEVFRIYYVNDHKTGATLTSRRNVAKSAPGRVYYYLWLLNHEMEYFWRAPAPFIKAAAMLPVVARYIGKPLREVCQELKNRQSKLLVFVALPLSLLLGVYLKLRKQWK
jgi:glycosyltransferase involved in cell wall biosynthesis